MLYQREITGERLSSILEAGTHTLEDGSPLDFCRQILAGVEEHLDTIDEVIGDTSEHWTVARMPLVDRNILRIATFELLHLTDVPSSVAINEAVELAKAYGGDDSSKFVNGVLGRIAEQHRSGRESHA
jgi:N utilization substance protein B